MKRVTKGTNIDQAMIDNLAFNRQAGAQKNTEVGRSLVAIGPTGAKTTNATTATPLPSKGKNIAVYNNSASLGSITLGTDGTVTVLASGVTSGDNVGIPCKANDWTYIACNEKQWVIASASTLLVFLIEDSSEIN